MKRQYTSRHLTAHGEVDDRLGVRQCMTFER